MNNVGLSEVPSGMLIPLALLIVVQLTVQVLALVRLFRTPENQLSARRWVWLVVILLGEIIGAVVFLAVGRKPAPAEDPQRPHSAEVRRDRAARAAEVLYGPQDGDRS